MNTYTTIMFRSVRCLLLGTHAPKIIGKKVARMGALNVWNIIMFYTRPTACIGILLELDTTCLYNQLLAV